MRVNDIKQLIEKERYSNLSSAFYKIHPFNFLGNKVNKKKYIEDFG